MWEERLKIYDSIVDLCPRFDRKGKSMPYTSANGYMFSALNKDGELGIRFSSQVQKNYIEQWPSEQFKSYGANMKGYVIVTDDMLKDPDLVAAYLNESYDYVMSLPPK